MNAAYYRNKGGAVALLIFAGVVVSILLIRSGKTGFRSSNLSRLDSNPEISSYNQALASIRHTDIPENITEATPTLTPEPGEPFLPSMFPERDVAFADIVAEVVVDEIYPARANNDSGVAPTRDPALAPGQNEPSSEKQLYRPIRLRVLRYYKTASPSVSGFIISEYAGTVADFDRAPLHLTIRKVDLNAIHEGDQAIVFLNPFRYGVGNPIESFSIQEATHVTATEALYEYEAASLRVWYRYDGPNAVSSDRATMPINELKARIQTYVASFTPSPPQTATPAPDGAGYFPPPNGITYQMITMAASPHSAFLYQLNSELSSHLSMILGARVQNHLPLKLMRFETLGGHNAFALNQSTIQTTLASLFGQESAPLIQGYFRSPKTTTGICLDVVITGWHGTATLPPFPISPMADESPPSTMPTQPSSWRLCNDQKPAWRWNRWSYGGYYKLVETIYQDEKQSTYYVIRP